MVQLLECKTRPDVTLKVEILFWLARDESPGRIDVHDLGACIKDSCLAIDTCLAC